MGVVAAAAGIGAGLQAVGSLVGLGQGLSEDEQAARDALAQKDLAETKAADALQRGFDAASRQRQEATQLIARQRVAYTNSGVDAQVGTAASVQENTRAVGEADAQTIENNAVREAWGLKRYAAQMGSQADAYRRRAPGRVAGTLLTVGAIGADAGSRWYGKNGGKP